MARSSTTFGTGPDPRRHVFTKAERAKGGRRAFVRLMVERPELLKWLQRKINKTAKPDTLKSYKLKRKRGEYAASCPAEGEKRGKKGVKK